MYGSCASLGLAARSRGGGAREYYALDARRDVWMAGCRGGFRRGVLEQHDAESAAMGVSRGADREQPDCLRGAAGAGARGARHGDVAVFLRRAGVLSRTRG